MTWPKQCAKAQRQRRPDAELRLFRLRLYQLRKAYRVAFRDLLPARLREML